MKMTGKAQGKIAPPAEIAEEENVINTIDLPDNAVCIQFYGDNLKIAIQTSGSILGFDVFTHVNLFKIQRPASKSTFKHIQVLFDDFLNFCDSTECLNVHDINYKTEKDYVCLKSKPLKRFDL